MSKSLFIVEGKSGEPKVVRPLATLLGPEYEIAVVGYPIYDLYQKLKNEKQYGDVVAFLRSEGKLPNLQKGVLSSEAFSAIYLVFDYDPQDINYSDSDLRDLLELFNNETELGKLYINYPMVEAVYDIHSYSDDGYLERTVQLQGLTSRSYKRLVKGNTCFDLHGDIDFRDLCYALKLNYAKVQQLTSHELDDGSYREVLNLQIAKKNKESVFYVLATILLLALDYNKSRTLEIVDRTLASSANQH